MIPQLFKHQEDDIHFINARKGVLNFSDAGTGKTRTTIEIIKRRKDEGRTLILCPKSIMYPAWGADLEKFAPELTFNLAYAEKRAEAFYKNSDIVIMNHDGVLWLDKILAKTPILNNFVQLVIDESTAYKNNCQRSNIVNKLKKYFKYRILMTGTPYTNSLTDIWRQTLIADDGQRLGNSFFKFRDQVCIGKQLGNGITIWEDKPNMEPIIFHLLKDIVIRHKLEDCIDIPENNTQKILFELNKKHFITYIEMETNNLLQLKEGKITAANAAILVNKLLQITSGAVYDEFGNYHLLDTDRYELIRDLAEARPQVLIAFCWRHQKDQLLKLLPQAKVIDGETSHKTRDQYIADFQNKKIPQLLIHPKSGAHGLTLTAGYATIWASPTYSSEEFQQFNRRIYRAGQTKKTETLLICAKNTIEDQVFQKLEGKLTRADNILKLFDRNLNP